MDGAIHRAAGPSVLRECQMYGGCKTGEAVITGAGDLKAKKIIHTPGPFWGGGYKGEPELLRNCYYNSFRLAKENGLETIAFPCISGGIYGYPIVEAAKIALAEGVNNADDFKQIRYVCFKEEDYKDYLRVYKELTSK